MADSKLKLLIDNAVENVASKYKTYLIEKAKGAELYNQYKELARQYKVHLDSGYIEGQQYIGNLILKFESDYNLPRNWGGFYLPEQNAKADYETALKELNDLKAQALTQSEQDAAAAALQTELNNAINTVKNEVQLNGGALNVDSGNSNNPVSKESEAAVKRKKMFIIGGVVLIVGIVIGTIIYFVKKQKDGK